MRKDLFKRPLHADAWYSKAEAFLGILLVIFINYLYSNITHKFRYLVQTYKIQTYKLYLQVFSTFWGRCENN